MYLKWYFENLKRIIVETFCNILTSKPLMSKPSAAIWLNWQCYKKTVRGKIVFNPNHFVFCLFTCFALTADPKRRQRHKTQCHWKFQNGKNCPLTPLPRSNMRFPQVSQDSMFNRHASAGVGKPRLSLENKNAIPDITLSPDWVCRERTVGEVVNGLSAQPLLLWVMA